jgi:hypothetical protein
MNTVHLFIFILIILFYININTLTIYKEKFNDSIPSKFIDPENVSYVYKDVDGNLINSRNLKSSIDGISISGTKNISNNFNINGNLIANKITNNKSVDYITKKVGLQTAVNLDNDNLIFLINSVSGLPGTGISEHRCSLRSMNTSILCTVSTIIVQNNSQTYINSKTIQISNISTNNLGVTVYSTISPDFYIGSTVIFNIFDNTNNRFYKITCITIPVVSPDTNRYIITIEKYPNIF